MRCLLKAACLIATLQSCLSLAAGEEPVYTSFFSNVALSGHDAVAYFTESKSIKGDSDFRTEYMGVRWYFVSEANLQAFEKEPSRYAPEYGGYCAWAVSQGYTAKGNPDSWTLVNGKLYLNFDGEVQKIWKADTPRYIELADKYWPGLIAP